MDRTVTQSPEDTAQHSQSLQAEGKVCTGTGYLFINSVLHLNTYRVPTVCQDCVLPTEEG